MGNQGMKNWKFSVFFVIALTLVAGLFADTAIAGSGDGKMVLAIQNGVNLLTDPQILKAGSKGTSDDNTLNLQFTYTADDPDTTDLDQSRINMNGGKVMLKVPADWAVKTDQVSVSETAPTDTTLYLRGCKAHRFHLQSRCRDKRSRP